MNLIKCAKSFKYACRGVRLVVRENNLKVHLLAALLVLIAGFILKISIQEWLWVSAAISSVMVAETVNTAIEKLTDLVSPDYHPLAGQTKDLAAGAVLIASVFAVVVGLLIFLPKIISFF